MCLLPCINRNPNSTQQVEIEIIHLKGTAYFHFNELIIGAWLSASRTRFTHCNTRLDAVVTEHMTTWCNCQPWDLLEADNAWRVTSILRRHPAGKWLKICHCRAMLSQLVLKLGNFRSQSVDTFFNWQPTYNRKRKVASNRFKWQDSYSWAEFLYSLYNSIKQQKPSLLLCRCCLQS